jgi:hypothetical protein
VTCCSGSQTCASRGYLSEEEHQAQHDVTVELAADGDLTSPDRCGNDFAVLAQLLQSSPSDS